MIVDIYTSVIGLVHTLASDLSGGEAISKGLVTVGILTSLGVICRKVPSKLWRLLLGRFTIRLVFADDWQGENRALFAAAGAFVAKHQHEKDLRILRADADNLDAPGKVTMSIVPSEVSGFFLHGVKPYWYSMEAPKEHGAVSRQLSIRTFGRTPSVILDVFDAEKTITESRMTRRFFEVKNKEWVVIGNIGTPSPIFIDPELKKKIDTKVDFFKNNRAWFENHGINYKLLIILEGPPGTGKSRLAKYIADRMGWSLGTITSPGSLTESIRSAARMNCVVSIPDVDAVGIGMARIGFSSKSEEKPEESTSSDNFEELKTSSPEATIATIDDLFKRDRDDLMLAEALNLFQGDIPLNNSIVVMSTNSIESLDAALTRPSRCDLVAYVGPLKYESFDAFFKHCYGTQDNLPIQLLDAELRACDLMESFTSHSADKEGFIESVLEYANVN